MVRAEEPRDHDAVRALNRLAFGANGEADLVDALRADVRDVISLVAEQDEIVVGHILFSPVTLSGSLRLPLAGLAPMAVLPAYQRSGIGSQLVAAGLDACRTHGFAAAVVLGYPEFYPRFGFRRASEFGMTCEYDAPDEAFMAIELVTGSLAGRSGIITYHPAFKALP